MGIMLGVPSIFNFVLNHFKLQYAMLNNHAIFLPLQLRYLVTFTTRIEEVTQMCPLLG